MSALGTKLRKLEGGQVLFRCPGCKSSHVVGVEAPAPLVWGFNGNGDAPTFTPSIFVNAPGKFHHPGVPSCHSFVTDGRIQFLSDCTHARTPNRIDIRPLFGPSGALSSQIFYEAAPDSVTWGSPMVYAATQQFGAAQGAFGRTSRNGPIPWGNIPARPFLGISAEDQTNILDAITEALVRSAAAG